MVLRINDGPCLRGHFSNNFTAPTAENPYPVFVHRQQAVGNNYEMVESGHIGVKPGSDAARSLERLIFGCGRIDIIHSPEQCIVCFRDAKVLVSSYLEIDDCNLEGVIAH